MSTLPSQFAELEPFVDTWALETEGERYAQRLASTMAELQTFYDAAMPVLARAKDHLEAVSLDDISDEDRTLLRLLCSLVTVSFPIEVWSQPRVPESGAAEFPAVVEPAI